MRLFAQTVVISAYTTGLIYSTLIIGPQCEPTPNFEPLRTISACWSTGGRTMVVNLVGNVALLAPLGLIGPWLWGGTRRWDVPGVLITGFVVSVAIEGTQYACGHRMADVDDILLNTIGAGMGYGATRGFGMVGCLGVESRGLVIEKEPVRGGLWLRTLARAMR